MKMNKLAMDIDMFGNSPIVKTDMALRQVLCIIKFPGIFLTRSFHMQ